VAAFGSAGRLIREGATSLKAISRYMVSGGLQRTGIISAGDAVGSVGTAVHQRLKLHRSDRAVLFHAGLEFHQDRMAAPVAVENLLARQADFDGPVQEQGRLGHDYLVREWLALASKSSAVGRGNHANMSRGHFQNLGQDTVKVMRRLRAGPDGQLSFGILHGQRSVLLDGKMSTPFVEKGVFENLVGLGEALLDIAELQRNPLMDVALLTV